MMYKYLIVLLVLVACTKNKDEVNTCFIITERQCASDPYQAYSKSTDSDKKNAIKEYLQVNGIKNIELTIYPPFTGAVCLACICPSGTSYSLQLAATDTTKLKTLGLLVNGIECN